MTDFDALFADLIREISDLHNKFLARFLPANPEHTPTDFEHEVKSFSLLCHAAFEEYIEAVSETVMNKIESNFLSGIYTISTVCLLSSYGIKFDLPDSDDHTDKTCFNHIRDALKEAKLQHSKALMDNHGFSIKYMRKLLIPVGINMPTGPEVESLKKLAEARGSFAHRMAKLAQYGGYRRALRVLTPEEASLAAEDCKAICGLLRDRAKSL